MGLEMQLVDQLEETIKDFERNITDMMSQFVESVQGLYPFQIFYYLFFCYTNWSRCRVQKKV